MSYGICKISSGSLNVRSSASTSGSVVFTLKKDEVIEILSTSGDWVRISHPSGTGYCSSQYIGSLPSSTNTGTVKVSGSLNVRTGPDTTFSKAFSLSNGNQVSIHKSQNGWYLISCSSGAGWCSSDYITLGGGSTGGDHMNTASFDMVMNGQTDPNTGKVSVFKIDTDPKNKQPGVATLQNYLIKIGYALTADGNFGANTDKAVRAFQTECEFTVDGIVGRTTAVKLNSARSDPNFTNPDYFPIPEDEFTFENLPCSNKSLLARIICAEHGYDDVSEDDDARHGVAKVLKNRYNNGMGVSGISYKDKENITWKSVIFADKQYSTATMGSKYLAFDVKRGTTAWPKSLSLAQTLLDGKTPSKAPKVTGQIFQKSDDTETSEMRNLPGYCRYPTTTKNGRRFTYYYNLSR